MAKWQIIVGGVGVLAGLGALCFWTNPKSEAFETFAIERVKDELCPQVPLGLAKDCPRLVDENQPMLKGWIRQNTQTQNYGLFTQYETTLSVRELVPEPARPFLGLVPLPESYRLRTIGVLGRFVIYGAESPR
ncbi:DUF4359 domain-containing protein [filamentous cyanobacterium LEGE 11480]|uniref:DUF4359 domain-containing protein n=1 Tax=Romeriopsis navalis LEGE 11480 TaxID=2777977 RepID=A0A928VKL3_9CYAN|nr:DUF4359 domain-containing protein [Romeriopsis navalis]MBE9030060.1 DUF4359 domain-containing protein [Romeriopsis navalis LEGE 11480]